jgi:hypothetical protein
MPSSPPRSIQGVTNVNATTENAEPPGEASKFSVWYVWYAQFDGTLAVTLRGHSTSVTLDAYSGTSYEDLTPVGSRNAAANAELNLTLAVTAQHFYYSRLGEASGSVADAMLSWKFTGGPVFPETDDLIHWRTRAVESSSIKTQGDAAEVAVPAASGHCYRLARTNTAR